MDKKQWLVLAVAMLAWFNAGTVWLTQFSCYPLWPKVGAGQFGSYYAFWQGATGRLLGLPFALCAWAAVVLLAVAPRAVARWALWAGVGLQAAIVGLGWALVRPLESRIVGAGGGLNLAALARLEQENRMRIGLVTLYALLTLWVLWRALGWHERARRGQLLLLATAALGMYSVGCVWLVQLVCYRLWPYVGGREAYAYHVAWWHSIWGPIFIPAGLVVLGSAAMLRDRPEGVTRPVAWFGFALQMVTYLLTAAWWGPLMARMVTAEAGMSMRLYHLLMATHWVRWGLITAYGAVCCFMLVASTTRTIRKAT